MINVTIKLYEYSFCQNALIFDDFFKNILSLPSNYFRVKHNVDYVLHTSHYIFKPRLNQ